jgi:hypothetical protein
VVLQYLLGEIVGFKEGGIMPLIIPEYIEIRNATGQTVAYLSPDADGLKEVWIDQRLNGECTLSFQLPLNSDKWSALTPECRIIAGGREFVVLLPDVIDIERDNQGKTWGKVTAHESWILLDKQYPTVSNDPQNPTPADLQVSIISGGPSTGGYPQGSAGSALTYLLQNSGWSVGTVDVTGTHDLETEKESLLANIKKVQEIWGGYLVWDSINKTVSLRAEATWQNYSGFQIRYAKNLKSITRTANYDIITRLYPFGQDDLDISSVNNGVKYLEDFSYTSNIYVGIYQNQDISDPQELKDKASEVLSKLCKPRYTYRVQIVDLRTLPEYSHEDFILGDLVDVIDEQLGINVRTRIIRHKYNVFQPWRCELELGEPEERLAVQLAESFDAARFVREALRPNPATSNLLKGFINTFATQINSANGKLVWNDSTLEAIEINANGNETGRRVRITPGGIGVSIDGGQTYETAMTGAGVLANKVIVNELYALATDDGLTKLAADGLHVYDRNLAERLIAGRWIEGTQEHFGLKAVAQDGRTVLLDDRGILQTWQEGRADNVDANNPLVLNIYLPAETREIKRALLRFKLQAFRAYETGAASGGRTSKTSSSYLGEVVTSSTQPSTVQSSAGSIWNYGTTYVPEPMTTEGGHNHGIPDGTALMTADGGTVWFAQSGYHTHAIDTDHNHNVTIPSHNHTVNIPSHSHTVDIPNHSHGLVFGIYTSTRASNITIKINGVDRTSILGGPFTVDQNSLDIKQYLSIGQWNTIEIGSSTLGRVDASLFIQTLLTV